MENDWWWETGSTKNRLLQYAVISKVLLPILLEPGKIRMHKQTIAKVILVLVICDTIKNNIYADTPD